MRVPTPPAPPRKPLSEQLKSVFALEEMLGKNWAAKAGIFFIVIGAAFFGITELGATTIGSSLTLFWPLASSGYGILTTTNLSAGNWTAIALTPQIVGNQWQVNLPVTGNAQYFRLYK